MNKILAFVIDVLKETKRKYLRFLWDFKIAIIGTFVGIFVGTVIFQHTQDYKIYKFQKDFAETNKPADDIYNEGLRLVSNADNPKECFVSTEAMWMLMVQEASKDNGADHLDVVEAANDKLHEDCK